MHIIKFNRSVGPYNKNDTAGFTEAIANRYIERQWASLVEVVEDKRGRKAQRQEEPPKDEEPVKKVIEPRSTKREYITK